MEVLIRTIPHSEQRYDTCGDWHHSNYGEDLSILVSNMGNYDYERLVALHEFIEAWLCEKRGISEESVTEFDIKYEKDRVVGDVSEPGDSLDAPYRNEHLFASGIEKLMCAELKIPWLTYENAVESL